MWPWNASTEGEIYIFHFHRPLGNLSNPRAQALHYCGFAEDLETRIAKQLAGRGARLVAAAMARGIPYDLFHWPAPLLVEKLVKRTHNTAQFCPACAAAAGRPVRPLPVAAIQLELPLGDDFPDLPVRSMGWLEGQIQRGWRQARPQLMTTHGLDDDLL